ncbi:MAG: TIGR01777 family oxidoreductase [Planctomycetaceae bacterium]
MSNPIELSTSTVAVSGAGGLVGFALCEQLRARGARVLSITRSTPSSPDEVQWDATHGVLEPAKLEGVTDVVHLAGESIADGRWTDAKKRRIRDSRVIGTRVLAQSLASLGSRPRTLVCASAIGFYGDRGDELLTERSPVGHGFLPEVCASWEAACEPASDVGIRVVNTRIGVILSRDGGALAKMLFPFKMGVGGKIGSGTQYMSWVSLDDVVGAILTGLTNTDLQGPVNAVSPNPVTNLEFTKVLGSVLHRPTILPMPAFAARLALGQMADDLLLASTRVLPERLQQAEYQFKFADLRACLQHELT